MGRFQRRSAHADRFIGGMRTPRVLWRGASVALLCVVREDSFPARAAGRAFSRVGRDDTVSPRRGHRACRLPRGLLRRRLCGRRRGRILPLLTGRRGGRGCLTVSVNTCMGHSLSARSSLRPSSFSICWSSFISSMQQKLMAFPSRPARPCVRCGVHKPPAHWAGHS